MFVREFLLPTRIENNSTLNFSQLALCLEREVFSSHVKNGLKLFQLYFPREKKIFISRCSIEAGK